MYCVNDIKCPRNKIEDAIRNKIGEDILFTAMDFDKKEIFKEIVCGTKSHYLRNLKYDEDNRIFYLKLIRWQLRALSNNEGSRINKLTYGYYYYKSKDYGEPLFNDLHKGVVIPKTIVDTLDNYEQNMVWKLYSKYIEKDDQRIGFLSGSTARALIKNGESENIVICTNQSDHCTKRVHVYKLVSGYEIKIIIRKPRVEITDENWETLQILELISTIPRSEILEYKGAIVDYMINYSITLRSDLLEFFPKLTGTKINDLDLRLDTLY